MKLDFHSKKALITGIDGFTGRYLKKSLQDKGVRVFGTVHSPSNEPDTYVADLLDSAALKSVLTEVKPDFVIHLAAISFVGHGDPVDFYRVNVIGTENLLNAILESGTNLKKVLVASSANIYGNTTGSKIAESYDPKPVNHYACSKVAMEKIVANYFNSLPIIITRPFNYTGVGQPAHFLVPKIVSHFKQKKSVIELGNTDVFRDFSSVHFVVESYVKLLTSDEEGATFNICSGESHSLAHIISDLEKLAGYNIQIKVNQDFVRKNEVHTIVGDNNKLLTCFPDLKIIAMSDILMEMFNS